MVLAYIADEQRFCSILFRAVNVFLQLMRRLRQFVLSDTVFSCHAVSIAPSEIEVVLCRDLLLLATCDSHALGSLATRRRLYLRHLSIVGLKENGAADAPSSFVQ